MPFQASFANNCVFMVAVSCSGCFVLNHALMVFWGVSFVLRTLSTSVLWRTLLSLPRSTALFKCLREKRWHGANLNVNDLTSLSKPPACTAYKGFTLVVLNDQKRWACDRGYHTIPTTQVLGTVQWSTRLPPVLQWDDRPCTGFATKCHFVSLWECTVYRSLGDVVTQRGFWDL